MRLLLATNNQATKQIEIIRMLRRTQFRKSFLNPASLKNAGSDFCHWTLWWVTCSKLEDQVFTNEPTMKDFCPSIASWLQVDLPSLVCLVVCCFGFCLCFVGFLFFPFLLFGWLFVLALWQLVGICTGPTSVTSEVHRHKDGWRVCINNRICATGFQAWWTSESCEECWSIRVLFLFLCCWPKKNRVSAIEALWGSARPGWGHAWAAKRIGTRTKRSLRNSKTCWSSSMVDFKCGKRPGESHEGVGRKKAWLTSSNWLWNFSRS